MKNIAVIAEYNPLHNGHKYQIEYIKNNLHADNIIVIMSGNFVQRGEPAIFSKEVRTSMALKAGADMVLELPCVYATGSAEFFAKGAIDSLEKTGIVKGICFGTETPDTNLLNDLSSLFINEPSEYQKMLKKNLSSGYSYPTARANACKEYLKNDAALEFLGKPNNILALEYIKELKRIKSSMDFYPLFRTDKGYNSMEVDNTLASASAIRRLLMKQDDISTLIPNELLFFYKKNDFTLASADNFSSMLHYALLQNKTTGYEAFVDCGKELSNRILTNLAFFKSFDQFADLLKTKNITRSRVNRVLIHILLGIKDIPAPSYIRLLGIKKEKTALITELTRSSSLPIINNVSKDISMLNNDAMKIFEKDIFASDLYRTILTPDFRRDERSYSLIKL